MLGPTHLAELERAGFAWAEGNKLCVKLPKSWAAQSEERIGYSVLVQLIECVRELHWRLDLSGLELDSITRSLRLEFLRPATVGVELVGSYRVVSVGRSSYAIEVTFVTRELCQLTILRGQITSVFYDAARKAAVIPPSSVSLILAGLASRKH